MCARSHAKFLFQWTHRRAIVSITIITKRRRSKVEACESVDRDARRLRFYTQFFAIFFFSFMKNKKLTKQRHHLHAIWIFHNFFCFGFVFVCRAESMIRIVINDITFETLNIPCDTKGQSFQSISLQK